VLKTITLTVTGVEDVDVIAFIYKNYCAKANRQAE